MVETIRYSKIFREDLAIGEGTQSIELANGNIEALTELSIASFFLEKTNTITPTAVVQLSTPANFIPAGARVVGVTVKVSTALGATNGLTGFDVGDANTIDRWGHNIGITLDTETSQSNFTLVEWPIFNANTAVVLTALGGTFDTTGAIEVKMRYFTFTH